jgi:hypothetical protein
MKVLEGRKSGDKPMKVLEGRNRGDCGFSAGNIYVELLCA